MENTGKTSVLLGKKPDIFDNRQHPEKSGSLEIGVSSDNRTTTEPVDAFEEWMEVIDYPSYEVSNTGKVRRSAPGHRTHVGRELKPYLRKDGYFYVDLWADKIHHRNRPVHVLVAEAFIGPKPPKMTVNHMDGDKTNNHATNLEYLTLADNIRHGHANGLYPRGVEWPTAKLSEDQVREIKRLLPHMNNCELARRYGVSDVSIRKIRKGWSWKHVA